MECERCGGPIERYRLGDHEALSCTDCGYLDVPVDHRRESGPSESWDEAFDRFYDRFGASDGTSDPSPSTAPDTGPDTRDDESRERSAGAQDDHEEDDRSESDECERDHDVILPVYRLEGVEEPSVDATSDDEEPSGGDVDGDTDGDADDAVLSLNGADE